MTIRDWPITDQPREKLFSCGAHTLTDSELLAIVINTGYRGTSALALARSLMQEHADLQALYQFLHTHPHAMPGIGRTKRALLLAAAEIGRRIQLQKTTTNQRLSHCAQSKIYIATRRKHHANEVFACLFLDNKLRLLKYEELFHGTINEASVYPREIIRRGLLANAAKIILAHNHPSGDSEPSTADIELTRLLKRTLNLVDIDLVDHIIIGRDQHFSFAENALL